jgi:hypothetical protein
MDNHNAPYVAASDTSRARAQREDNNGTTRNRRTQLLSHLDEIGVPGAIWSDLAELTGSHHGQVSGALSKLHELGHVFQLRETREGCHPYVHTNYRWAYDDNAVHDHPVKTRATVRTELLENVAEAAHNLCYAQSAQAGTAWAALRHALEKLKEHDQ